MKRLDNIDKLHTDNMDSGNNKKDISGKTRIFAVAGNPVLHSKSPDIFNAAFDSMSIPAVYTRFAASRVEEIIEGALDMGMNGFNLTTPFKEDIIPFLDKMDEKARSIRAVNTVVVDKGRLYGFNTDIEGVRRAFSCNGIETMSKRAVVLGAGGAAKAAACALVLEGADVTILNRTFAKAKSISEHIGCKSEKMDKLANVLKYTDIIVSCLSSAERVINPNDIKADMTVLDANYGFVTPLSKDAKVKGCAVIDGREWLLFQGASAFSHFIGLDAPLYIMRDALYKDHKAVKRNISLIGFMGTGKTTIAENVAKMNGMALVDIDKKIEQETCMPIAEIFQEKGETSFRDIEEKYTAGISGFSNTVVACGGGVILKDANRDMLKKNSIVIWLWASIENIMKRVGSDNGRPLINGNKTSNCIREMLIERLPLYAGTSDMIINTNGLEPFEISRKICDETVKFLKD